MGRKPCTKWCLPCKRNERTGSADRTAVRLAVRGVGVILPPVAASHRHRPTSDGGGLSLLGFFWGGGEWGRHALPPPAPPSPRRRRLASVRGAVSRVGRWWPPTAGVPSPRSAATRVLASPLRGAQDGRARARPHMEIVLGALCMLLVPLPSPRCRPAATAAPVASGAPPLWTRAQPPPTGGRRTLSTPTVAAAGAADDGRWGRRAQAVARCHAREGRDRCQARGP